MIVFALPIGLCGRAAPAAFGRAAPSRGPAR